MMKKVLSNKNCNFHEEIYPIKETEFDGSDLKASLVVVQYSFYIFLYSVIRIISIGNQKQ